MWLLHPTWYRKHSTFVHRLPVVSGRKATRVSLHVCEALKSERLKFETRTTAMYRPSLDEQQALSNYVARMEALVKDEVTYWRAQLQKAASPRETVEREE